MQFRLPRFTKLRTRLTVCYLALFMLVLMGILGGVYVSISSNAERVVRNELDASAVVFERIWELRTRQLLDSADLLTKDFGFRAAVASGDRATIDSALHNLRARLGLDLAFVVDSAGQVVAVDGVAAGSQEVAKLSALAESQETDGVFVLGGVPYLAVTSPILAPIRIGQVVFAARIDARQLDAVARLSPIPLHPQILVEDRNGRWTGAGDKVSAAELANASQALKAFATDPSRSNGARRVGAWVEVARPLNALGEDRTALLLRYPIAQALAPYQGLLALVLILGAGGLGLVAAGGWALAREVTRPILALKDAAERLERGEGVSVGVDGADEVAALGLTFNHMSAEIRRREEALTEARRDAEAANEAKSTFLANMSHEIRTPLNGILGMAQVLARDDAEGRQGEQLRVIRESGEALLAILNSVLDLSEIEGGRLEIADGDFDLAALVDHACRPFAGLAREKALAFDIGVDADAAGTWRGDAVRIEQVLVNLASNAVKFTEAGRVAIQVRRTPCGLDFELSDTGAGIASDQVEQIFGKFLQGDNSSTRGFGGAGLGLSICQELVRLMGGELRLESQPGRGSVFGFELPLERVAEPARQSPPAAAAPMDEAYHAPPLRILAAEDNTTNQMILTALLAPVDAEMTMVEDGVLAVEAFGVAPYDLVLMDIQMPNRNGVEATRDIRRMEAERGLPRAPIIAVTANVMSEQIAEYRAAGMDGVVAKPVQAEALFNEIERVLDERQRAAA